MQKAACHLLIGTDLAKLMGHFVTGFKEVSDRGIDLGHFLPQTGTDKSGHQLSRS